MAGVDPRIPEEYRSLWVPAIGRRKLVHHTTIAILDAIVRDRFLEPRDPAPKHWGGLVAVFLADPADQLYALALADVLAHVREKGESLVRLHIRTANVLYRSVDPHRTFQVISLDPIAFRDVTKVEVI